MVGGLIGEVGAGGAISIIRSFGAGAARGENSIGGLIGLVETDTKLIFEATSCFAAAEVEGNDPEEMVGQLVGDIPEFKLIESNYFVSGSTCTNSTWSCNFVGDEVEPSKIFAPDSIILGDWDTDDIWLLRNNQHPVLR